PQSARTAYLRHTRSYVHLPTRLRSEAISSLELLTELDQTAGNAAGDRAGGGLELLAARPVRLVAGEEAGENLPATLGQAGHRLMHVERLVDPRDRVLVGVDRELALVGHVLS